MNYLCLKATAPRWLQESLAVFESQFHYPLGPGSWFRISHGPNYPRFFRAMGEAAVFVAEHEGVVYGTIGVALKTIQRPAGGDERIAYFGDFKVAPAQRGKAVAAHLLRDAADWALLRVSRAIAVVMDGTAVLPTEYTGRLGLPPFQPLDHLVLLRIPVEPPERPREKLPACDSGCLADSFRTLTSGQYSVALGEPILRSRCRSTALVTADAGACGMVEDTRRAKRLFRHDGVELVSGHLSSFAYRSVEAGVELVHAALDACRQYQLPALFVPVSVTEAENLATALNIPGIVRAPATVFGCGFEPGARWHIHTSEI